MLQCANDIHASSKSSQFRPPLFFRVTGLKLLPTTVYKELVYFPAFKTVIQDCVQVKAGVFWDSGFSILFTDDGMWNKMQGRVYLLALQSSNCNTLTSVSQCHNSIIQEQSTWAPGPPHGALPPGLSLRGYIFPITFSFNRYMSLICYCFSISLSLYFCLQQSGECACTLSNPKVLTGKLLRMWRCHYLSILLRFYLPTRVLLSAVSWTLTLW